LPRGSRARTAVVLGGGLLAAVLLPSLGHAQCAMCKATLESTTDGVGAQFNRAILVMLAGPYLVMGVFGLVVFRERLRKASGRLIVRLRRPAGPGRAR
jgi:hypothetical protein